MARRFSWLLLVALLVLVLAVVGGGPLAAVNQADESTGEDPGVESTDEEPGVEFSDGEQVTNATATFVDENGTVLGRIYGPLAETVNERRTGLSDTDQLAPNEGMVFVYEETATRHFVMRDMAFPIDIIFVDGDGEITAIYEAATDDDGTFSAPARWVIEVNRGYAEAHGIEVGDTVRELPR